MLTADDITAALRQHLPAELQGAIPALAQVLADATTGVLHPQDAQARLTANPNLAAALRALAGQEVNAGGSVISFGAGAQMGDVSIGDVAGRDVVKIHLDVKLDVQQTIGTQQVINAQAGANIGSVIGSQTNYYNSYAAPVRSRQEQRNRQVMLQKVKAIWITGLLEKSLTAKLRIELSLIDRPDAVDIPINTLYQERESDPQPLPAGTSIADVFDQAGGELLILGAPGAGKTLLLLELLRDLLQRAEENEAHPLPVIFNLSTWASERKPLREWMSEQLRVQYGVPKKVGKAWVDENELLPLLDGLDEVAHAHRDACVDAINQYDALTPKAVCSRIADYKILRGKLKLQRAVSIEALTGVQVESYLLRQGEPLREVRELLYSDPVLVELLNNPLMLSIVTLTLRDAALDVLRAVGGIDERRAQLWEMYITRMFSRRGKIKAYARQQTKRWLAWLARQMTRDNLTVFYIEQLQPSYLPLQHSYASRLRLFIWLVCGLFGGLINGLYELLNSGLSGGLFGLLSGIVVFGLIGGLINGPISTSMYDSSIKIIENLRWSWSNVLYRLSSRNHMKILLDFGILIVLASGTFGGLYGWIVDGDKIFDNAVGSGVIISLFISLFVWLMSWLGFGIISGIVSGLIIGLMIAPPIIALIVPLGGMTHSEVTIRTQPNQGIRDSLLNGLFGMTIGVLGIGAAFGLFGTLIFGQSSELKNIMLYGVILGGLGIGLNMGGRSVIQHYTLRYLLYRQGFLSLRDLIPWLDYCAERLLLRKVGGGYIFIHRLLMEHFAAMTDEDIARLSGEIEGQGRAR